MTLHKPWRVKPRGNDRAGARMAREQTTRRTIPAWLSASVAWLLVSWLVLLGWPGTVLAQAPDGPRTVDAGPEARDAAALADAGAEAGPSDAGAEAGLTDAGPNHERALLLLGTARAIRDLMSGSLELQIEPSDLFDIALNDEPAVALERQRLRALISAAEVGADAGESDAGADDRPRGKRRKSARARQRPEASEDAGIEADADAATGEPVAADPELWTARLQLDRARHAFLSLPKERRDELLERHAKRQQQGEEAQSERALSQAERKAQLAAAARQKALLEAQRARSEAKRLLSEERARLLGVKVALAQHEAGLARKQRELEQTKETALGWRRRIQELRERRLAGEAAPVDADLLYSGLRQTLRDLRIQLHNAISAGAAPASVPLVGPDPLQGVVAPAERGEVDRVRQEVIALHARLAKQEAQFRWTKAVVLHDLVGALNDARLSLYPQLSLAKRSALTSFSAEGLEQAGAELWQVGLMLRFGLLAARHWVSALQQGDDTRSELWFLGFDLLKLLALLLAIWWLQRRLGSLVRSQRERYATPVLGIGQSGRTRAGHLLLIVDRIWRPLGWLFALWLMLVILGPGVRQRLEVQLLWILLSWPLGGIAVVNLLDALAARHDLADTKQTAPALRLRSLKLLGRVVVVIGLALALTRELLGRGTVYDWVLSTCWFLALPVALWIIVWWRSVIYERLQSRAAGSTLAAWALGHRQRWTSFLGAAVGGVYLLGVGAARAVSNYLYGFTVTRRLLAYLFRRELARQSKLQEAAGALVPVSEARCVPFDPEAPAAELLPTAADGDLQRVLDAIDAPGGGVFALVGERGSGKSTLLSRIVQAHPDCSRVTCPPGGLAELRARLLARLGLDASAEDEQIRLALDSQTTDRALLIDDAQRLVSPAIGGLRDLDSLLELARTASEICTWVLAFDTALWEFVQRARGVRPLFDGVIWIKPWPEEMIAALVRQRSAQAGFQPRFDHLLVTGTTDPYQRAEQLARTQAGYYRLLWDYAAGNPAVALRFWRHSLHEDEAGEVFVQLFEAPSTADLEALPDAAVFVLKAVIQLEPADVGDLVRATRLPPREVEQAVRYARSRGYLRLDNGRLSVNWDWFRAVSRLLQRRHLLGVPGGL